MTKLVCPQCKMTATIENASHRVQYMCPESSCGRRYCEKQNGDKSTHISVKPDAACDWYIIDK